MAALRAALVGATVTVTNGADLAVYIDSNDPYIILVSGTVSMSGMNHARPNKSIIGLGSNAGIVGGSVIEPSDFYGYALRNASEIKTIVMQGAGVGKIRF